MKKAAEIVNIYLLVTRRLHGLRVPVSLHHSDVLLLYIFSKYLSAHQIIAKFEHPPQISSASYCC